MVLHIAKRELYDHFNSLRFAFTVLLFLALMIANAIGYFGEYNIRCDGIPPKSRHVS